MTIGRVFHEFLREGDIYHPAIDGWSAEELIPGGFGPAQGRISESVFRKHRDLFEAGAQWYTFLEADGSCIHAGALNPPDNAGGIVTLSDRGRATIADREIGDVLYQTDDALQFARYLGGTGRWDVSSSDLPRKLINDAPFEIFGNGTCIEFTRTADVTNVDAAQAIIPIFGQDLTRLACDFYMTVAVGDLDEPDSSALIQIYVARHQLLTNTERSPADLIGHNGWLLAWEGTIGANAAGGPTAHIPVDIDLHLNADDVTGGDNRGASAGITYTWPDVIMISVGQDDEGSEADPTTVIATNIRINGAVGPALGADRFTPSDIVADLAGRVGIGHTSIEPTAINVIPYVLGDGQTPADAFDHAALLAGNIWRILDAGSGPMLRFEDWGERQQWTLADPHAPFEPIGEERFDTMWIPFRWGSLRQTGKVKVRLEDSPLDAPNVLTGFDVPEPTGTREHSEALGQQILSVTSRRRFSGSFKAATLRGEDGVEHSAHKARAGDTLRSLGRGGGRLRIGKLVHRDEAVEGEFDAGLAPVERILERRAQRIANRRRPK